MPDSLGKVIAIFLAAILMFIFPLMEVLNRQDDVVQAAVQAACERFVSDVRAERKITIERYAALVSEIEATGNKYGINLERKVADENPDKKGEGKIGELIYYSEYSEQILNVLEEDGIYYLKQGDYIGVSVEIENQTIAGLLQGVLFGSNANKFKIAGSASRRGNVINEITEFVYYICNNNIANHNNHQYSNK